MTPTSLISLALSGKPQKAAELFVKQVGRKESIEDWKLVLRFRATRADVLAGKLSMKEGRKRLRGFMNDYLKLKK